MDGAQVSKAGTQWDWSAQTRARSAEVDRIVTGAAAEYLFLPHPASGIAVVAVGGYGRTELFPYSDVDVLILLENESAVAGMKEPLAGFLRSLWDAGLRASHSVRTVAECCKVHEGNTELHISLLDTRLVCGDASLFERLLQGLSEFTVKRGEKISQRLAELTRYRHAKFNHTVYHLEPNIKEVPGGIRDVHFLRWLAALSRRDSPVADWPPELDEARSFLYQVRLFLHNESQRDNNLLSFEFQDKAAHTIPEQPLSAEEWMRQYYKRARLIFQAGLRALEFVDSHNPSLLRQLRDWRQRLSTAEFTVSRDRVFLRNANTTLSAADRLLELFIFAGRHGIQLSWDTQRRLQSELRQLQHLSQQYPIAWSKWKEFFSQPHTGMALREMQETGLLAALIPPWRSIDSLVVRDFYHRYTVDEHTLVAIDSLDQLLVKREGVSDRFHDLLSEEHEPEIVRLALLLHDIGKGVSPGDHVRGSEVVARQVLQDLGTPEHQLETILFLIREHLVLSSIMNGRDLGDPATARFLTSQVDTQEKLRRLALLTYADISAVNPTALTPWRSEQLWRVYSTGLEQLTRELATNRIPDSTTFSDSPEMGRFLEGLPSRYLRAHSRSEIQDHLELWRKSRAEGVAVQIKSVAASYLLTVVVSDRPGLFASLCGALAAFGMNIVKAEAASNRQGDVLDLIRFTDPMRTLELNPDEVNRLQWTIECVARGTVEVKDLLERRRTPKRPSSGVRIYPRVHFSNDASDLATLIDFVGEDRPGLLHDLASTLATEGCNIDVVMIDTEAHKAIDVFYVTREGRKLDEALQEQLRSQLERAAVH